MANRGHKQHNLLALAAVLSAAILTVPGTTFFSTGESKGAQLETRTGSSRTPARRDAARRKWSPPEWGALLGKKVRGVVTEVKPLSADIDLGAGVIGNFHIANFGTERVEKGEDVFHVGQEVDARLHRFTGSRFELISVDNPKALPPVGTEVRGTVTKLNALSADVNIEGSEVQGNFHVALFNTERIEKAEDVFHVGQEVIARVKGWSGRRLELSRVDHPMFALPLSTEVRGTVTKLNALSADVDIEGSEVLGNFHVAHFANERIEKAEDVFHVGQKVTGRVKAIGAPTLALARVDHPFFLAIVED